jgi:hypothetical protein
MRTRANTWSFSRVFLVPFLSCHLVVLRGPRGGICSSHAQGFEISAEKMPMGVHPVTLLLFWRNPMGSGVSATKSLSCRIMGGRRGSPEFKDCHAL